MTVCYLCGGPNNGSLGKCQSCAERLEVKAEHQQVAALIRVRQQRRSEILFWCCSIPLLLGVVFGVVQLLKSNPATIHSDAGYYYVSDKGGTSVLRYARGASTRLEGRIFQYGDHSGSFREGGIGFEFAYLSESDYTNFVRQYGNSRECPASFYNAHMQILFLITDSLDVLTQLRGCNFNRWDTFTLTGQYLEFVDGRSPQGRIALPGGKQRYFYVRSATLKSKNC